MRGTRLSDTPIGKFPVDYGDLPAGAYWFATVREDHPEYPRRLNVKDHPEDRRWWGSQDDPRYIGNLTGLVLGIITPDGRYGMLSIHTVRENEDGTVSVLPNDGSSNSILVKGGANGGQYHGYIHDGVWREC
jgi:hypothetical protein